MRILFLLLFFLFTTVQAELNSTQKENKSVEANVTLMPEIDTSNIGIALSKIDNDLKDDLWYTKYKNHQIYIDLEKNLNDTQEKIEKYNRSGKKTKLSELVKQRKAYDNQLELLRDFRIPPFQSLTEPEDIKHVLEIESPFDIFSGFAYMKSINKDKTELKKDLDSLQGLINKLSQKEKLFMELSHIYGKKYNKNRLNKLHTVLDDIVVSKNIADNTYRLYSNKIDDNIAKTSMDIKAQVKRLFTIAAIIAFIFLISFGLKYLAKRTITDNERYYMANKVINFTNFFFVLLALLVFFVENVSYLVTVLGFVSAGLAFAMKDFFMSMFGWMVISIGGSFHVGDRIKVMKNGVVYVGDIVDISVLRMTILEDITLTTYDENRRAGRIIFVPNNYIFTELMANYTHGKIKTVWDGVDFMITFDSNHKKAAHISKEIVKKYSKGYTDISRKQLNKLRSQYSLKNINVEPRIFTFMEEHGVKISCWYMTNSYATLTLRSNIFSNILDAIKEEDDIKIAFPTQVINIKKDQIIAPPKEEGEV